MISMEPIAGTPLCSGLERKEATVADDATLREVIRKVEMHTAEELPYCRESIRRYYGDLADHDEVVGAIARRKAELAKR